MWIVRIALNRPYTFVVLAVLILFVGPIAILRTPTDIFPNIDIPVVTVVWNYGGLSADELSYRIVNLFERGMTTTVNDIEHIESQTLRGTAVIKVFFQPGAKIEAAIAQITAIAQTQPASDAAGHDTAVHHHLQRVERSDPPAWSLGQGLVRAAAVRLRRELHPHAARDRARRVDPTAVRRQATADSGRPRSGSAPGQRLVAQRRGQRDQRAEPDPPGGDLEDRRHRIRRPLERQPRQRRGAQRPPNQDGRARPRSTSGTSHTSATAIRRRRTSFASTASAARC